MLLSGSSAPTPQEEPDVSALTQLEMQQKEIERQRRQLEKERAELQAQRVALSRVASSVGQNVTPVPQSSPATVASPRPPAGPPRRLSALQRRFSTPTLAIPTLTSSACEQEEQEEQDRQKSQPLRRAWADLQGSTGQLDHVESEHEWSEDVLPRDGS